MTQGASLQDLIKRIGSEHVERRLEIETQHEAQLFGQGLLLFNMENWRLAPWLVETALKLTLQLPFCLEVSAPCDCLVSSAPE